MTDFFSISDARQAMKGSFVGTVTNIGDLKSGTNAKGDWTMKIITISDGSGREDMAVFNDEIKLFKLNCKYEITTPWWKEKDGKLSLTLGQYAKVKMVSEDSPPETTIPIDDESQERINKINKKVDSLPEIDEILAKEADFMSLTMYQIKQRIDKNIRQFEDSPNQGMIWEMTKIIYEKHSEAAFKKVRFQL